jgi:DNA helicase-2/ATP-dependent DNA helicase PcrA
VRNILDFENDYPDARIVKLERNYRSTRPILEGASGVVANNRARREKSLFTEREGGQPIRLFEASDDREEALFVVREILAATRGEGRRYADHAIFYRTNAQSRVFEEELMKYAVPYVVVGGVRFYDRAEVKDALAYLRLVLNPADSAALRRIVNRPARGIGKSSVERAEAEAAARGVPLLEGLRSFAASEAGARAAPKIQRFLDLIAGLERDIRTAAPAQAIARVLDQSGYLTDLEREGGPEAEARLENLRELIAAAEDFERVNAEIRDDVRSELELFLDQVALVSDLDEYDRRDDVVSLMTTHSAKGLEYPIVFLSGMEEGIFPHSNALRDDAGIEEERRLCYVGMTRAMERLTISCAAERLRFGSRTYGVPSRFLREIPPQVVEHVGGRAAQAPSRERAAASGTSYDYTYSQEAPSDTGSVAPGLRVRHPHFGIGVVLSVAGQGPSQKLKVRFERAGVKTLVLRYANLELG